MSGVRDFRDRDWKGTEIPLTDIDDTYGYSRPCGVLGELSIFKCLIPETHITVS